MSLARWTYLGVCLGSLMASCQGQTFIPVPESSQRAVVIQRIGLTDITIVYHRPLVGGRKIWGGVVPLGQVWRAGANENTTIEFSDAVTIEGQALAKGIYGLHMIPGPESWTVIFSKNATSWGSFSYDEKEDALRVTVKPGEIDFHEALAYEFQEVKPGSAQATLKWEKVSVPFVIAVADDVVLEHFRNSLRTGAQYYWEGWDEAASYCMSRKINYEEALQWSDKSIQAEERFENLATKRDLLKALNRADEAAAVWNRATDVAGPMQLYFYGRGLQFRNQPAEALDTFRATAKRFPEHWVGHLALARVKSSEGDFSTAATEVKAAQAAGVPEQQKANVEKLLHRLEAARISTNSAGNSLVGRWYDTGLIRAAVQVFVIHTPAFDCDAGLAVLSAAEIERANRYRFDEDRRRYIAGRATLRRILTERTEIPADRLVISEAEWQKPRLDLPSAAPFVSFNVSHSGDYVVIAASNSFEVGVDIEQVRADCPVDDLARRYYAEREHHALRKLPPERRLRHFYRLWTVKEAVLKCAGLGLSVPPKLVLVEFQPDGNPTVTPAASAPPSLSGLFVRELDLAAGYVSAVAAQVNYAEIEILNRKYSA